jgi:hypothetical protein
LTAVARVTSHVLAAWLVGAADSSVPHAQSVMLYDALKREGREVTLGLID